MNSVMNFIDQVMELFAKYGDRVYLGEAVTQREHALQAATLAEKRNGSASQIAAALLHDIGHIINVSESEIPKFENVIGRSNKAEAKIAGITPAVFIFSGKCDDSPP